MRNKKYARDYQKGKTFYKFLESRIGKHWDDVYSEICNFRNDIGFDFKRRIKWCVEKDIYFDKNGLPFVFPVYYGNNKIRGLWVHPVTGILMAPPKYPTINEPVKEINIISVNEGMYEKIEDNWYYFWTEIKTDTIPLQLIELNGEIQYQTEEIKRKIQHKRQVPKKEIEDVIFPLLHSGYNKDEIKQKYRTSNPEYKQWQQYHPYDWFKK